MYNYGLACIFGFFLQVGILKRVLEEVDKIVKEFKETLYKSMDDPHIEVLHVSDKIRVQHLFVKEDVCLFSFVVAS